MAKIGIFYGSSTGYTAGIAEKLAKALGVSMADVYDVAQAEPSKLGDYDIILLGCSTWGAGDIQDDMADFLDGADQLYLAGKKIAIFGCGDQTMSHTFNSAEGIIYQRMQKTGADFIAPFNADGYEFEESGAKVDGKYVGLMLDEVNHPELTDSKIAAWTKLIK